MKAWMLRLGAGLALAGIIALPAIADAVALGIESRFSWQAYFL
ncbi:MULTISPECIES: hypothetical protein [Tenebrionibacter/Tenebrionicola group]|jgi:hypothetical protein|nr:MULTISPECIES: hypothetical protein [Tenebrionibacter/Tenebrionicola group]